MAKQIRISCITKKIPSWQEFNLLLEAVDLDDSIGHLFVVGIFLTIKTQPKNKRYTTVKYIHL